MLSSIQYKEEFIYLGSTISDKGNIAYDIKAEINKQERRMNKFFAFLNQHHDAPIFIKEKFLESCIFSSVIYNCESWGNANLENLEKKYRKALRFMLGIRKSVCNEFPYIELGYPTLTSIVHKRQLKFYNDCQKDKDFPMQRYIIRRGIDANCTFINHYMELDNKYNTPDDIVKESFTDLQNSVTFKANLNRSKYVAYLKMNPSLQRPSLYDRYIPTYKLQSVSRIRMVSHNLQIEKGRHRNPPKPVNDRLCSCGQVEDESHFIQHCTHYTHIRRKYVELEHLPLYEQLDNIKTADFVDELFRCRKLFEN